MIEATDNEQMNRFLTYTLGAAIYAIAMYSKNAIQDDSVKFDPLYAGTTVLVGAVAGGIMASQGDEFSGESLAAAMGMAVPVVDRFLNMFLEDPKVKAPNLN